MSVITYTVEGSVGRICMHNAPDNRLCDELITRLGEISREISADDSIRVVLMESTGESFCRGGDPAEGDGWASLDRAGAEDLMTRALDAMTAYENIPVPVITKVQGPCLGGGLEVALYGDIIISSENAVFSHIEQAVGIVTLLGGVQRMADRAGKTKALQWAYTSQFITAQEMYDAGVVNQVVPHEDLDRVTMEWVERIGNGATLAHKGHKQLVRAWSDGGVKAADDLLIPMSVDLFQTEDARGSLTSAIEDLRSGNARREYKFSGK